MVHRSSHVYLALCVITVICCCTSSSAITLMEAVLSGSSDADVEWIQLGWKGAAQNLNTKSSANINSVTESFASGTGLPQSIVASATKNDALAVFGLYDDDSTYNIMQDSGFTTGNLVLFGPYTQSTGVRQWSSNVYFMSPDPVSELIALMNYMFSGPSNLLLGQIGLMTLSSNIFDSTIYNALNNQLLMLGLNSPIYYNEPVANTFDVTIFNTFMAQKPTFMFVFGARGPHTTSFFTALIQNTYVLANANTFYMMLPFALMYSTGAAYQPLYMASSSSVLAKNRFCYSTPLPSPSDSSNLASKNFMADIAAMNSNIGGTQLQTTSGYLVYYGWLFMQQLYYITNMYNTGGGRNLAAIKTNVFLQNRYLIGDIVLGNYGGSCGNSVTGTRLGAACECNQGGHYVGIGQFGTISAATSGVSSNVVINGIGQQTFPNIPCYTNQNVTAGAPSKVYGIALSLGDNSFTSDIGTQIGLAISEATNTARYSLKSPLKFTTPAAALSVATAADAPAAVATQATTTTLGVLFGPVAEPYTPEAMSNYLFVEPIVVPPPFVRSASPNVMYVTPSLSQEIHAVAKYLSTLASTTTGIVGAGVHARVRTENDAMVLSMIRGSLGHFNVQLNSGIACGGTVTLAEMIPSTGYTFLFGLQQSDLVPIKTFLAANPSAYVILWFEEISVYYSNFTTAFGTSSSPFMSQVLFATNLPSWTQSGSGSIFETFVSNVASSAHTPSAMRAFMGAIALDSITAASRNISALALQRALYKLSSFEVGGQVLGPYIQSSVVLPKTSPMNGPINYGGREIAVWSYARIVSTSTAYVYDPEAHTVLYAKLPDLVEPATTTTTSTATPTTTTTTTTTTTSTLPPCKLTTSPAPTVITTIAPTTTAPPTLLPPASHSGSSHAGLYVLLVILSLLLVAAVLFAIHLCCTVLPCFGGEPFNNAPMDCDAATTMIFAELVKWTDLQHLAPDAATECVAEYRNIVRRLVEKHDCYEAGSINDAFMVVSRHADSALKFAASLQKELDRMHGPAVDAVDAAYAGLGLPSSACVRGLRVRVGVHTDVVDIAYDVDTDHYEYRGSGCVAALRTERLAHGGQVLVTGATCEALTEKQLGEVHAVSVGTHSFDEYDEPVPLLELVVLPQREFGGVSGSPATLELRDPVTRLCMEVDPATSEEESQLALALEIITIAHSSVPVSQRARVLRDKCLERGLHVPKRGSGVTEERYAQSLLKILSDSMCSTQQSETALGMGVKK